MSRCAIYIIGRPWSLRRCVVFLCRHLVRSARTLGRGGEGSCWYVVTAWTTLWNSICCLARPARSLVTRRSFLFALPCFCVPPMPGKLPTTGPPVSTWPLSASDVHNAKKGLRFAKSLKAWPITLGAIVSFAIYPALTDNFKSNPFGLFDDDN